MFRRVAADFSRLLHTTGVTIELHSWNTGFAWQDHTGPFVRLSIGQVEQFDEDGYVVVDDLLDADTVARVTEIIDGFEAETERRLRAEDGERQSISEAGAITF